MMVYSPESNGVGLADREWPQEVDLILSAMAAGRAQTPAPADAGRNRRVAVRANQRICAELRLFSDLPGSEPWIVFTRDASLTGMGFLCQRRIPLGQAGRVIWFDRQGRLYERHCTVRRCREAVSGWFEGALHFD